MKNLREKLQKQEGFTLIEMLIVVAIIAILIAVSIPMVSTALESAKLATDAANERSAKAEALLTYMTNQNFEEGAYYYYNAASGELALSSDTGVKGYGQSTSSDVNDITDGILAIAVTTEGDVWFNWVKGTLDADNWYKNNGPATCKETNQELDNNDKPATISAATTSLTATTPADP